MSRKEENARNMTVSVNGGPESAPFSLNDMKKVSNKLAVDLDQHDRLTREDDALDAYIRLEAEKAAAVADFNERLKNLWTEVELCHKEVRDPQRTLPLKGEADAS